MRYKQQANWDLKKIDYNNIIYRLSFFKLHIIITFDNIVIKARENEYIRLSIVRHYIDRMERHVCRCMCSLKTPIMSVSMIVVVIETITLEK